MKHFKKNTTKGSEMPFDRGKREKSGDFSEDKPFLRKKNFGDIEANNSDKRRGEDRGYERRKDRREDTGGGSGSSDRFRRRRDDFSDDKQTRSYGNNAEDKPFLRKKSFRDIEFFDNNSDNRNKGGDRGYERRKDRREDTGGGSGSSDRFRRRRDDFSDDKQRTRSYGGGADDRSFLRKKSFREEFDNDSDNRNKGEDRGYERRKDRREDTGSGYERRKDRREDTDGGSGGSDRFRRRRDDFSDDKQRTRSYGGGADDRSFLRKKSFREEFDNDSDNRNKGEDRGYERRKDRREDTDGGSGGSDRFRRRRDDFSDDKQRTRSYGGGADDRSFLRKKSFREEFDNDGDNRNKGEDRGYERRKDRREDTGGGYERRKDRREDTDGGSGGSDRFRRRRDDFSDDKQRTRSYGGGADDRSFLRKKSFREEFDNDSDNRNKGEDRGYERREREEKRDGRGLFDSGKKRPIRRQTDDLDNRRGEQYGEMSQTRPKKRGKVKPEDRFERATNPAKTKGKTNFHQSAYTSVEALFNAHPNGVRLNKYVAHSGLCSRRKADEIIGAGKITVNDTVVCEMGHRVQAGDVIKYKDKIVEPVQKVYILLNKPKDYITTTDDPQGRRTVMDLVGGAADERLYPIGRLDRNTTGLLLLTNDGELAQKLSHPSHEVRKVYWVELDRPLTKVDFKRIVEGVELEDGLAKIDELSYNEEGSKAEVFIELHIGRNRIVRRIFEHLGYEINKLDRIMYAELTKKDLPRGRWRYLTNYEIRWLKYGKAAPAPQKD